MQILQWQMRWSGTPVFSWALYKFLSPMLDVFSIIHLMAWPQVSIFWIRLVHLGSSYSMYYWSLDCRILGIFFLLWKIIERSKRPGWRHIMLEKMKLHTVDSNLVVVNKSFYVKCNWQFWAFVYRVFWYCNIKRKFLVPWLLFFSKNPSNCINLNVFNQSSCNSFNSCSFVVIS